jgi:CRP-like cAMP-binding protein
MDGRDWDVRHFDAKDWVTEPVRRSAVERRLAAGQRLFSQGEPTVGLYQVVSGKIRHMRTDAEGRETVVSIGYPGDTIAESSLFVPVYHCYATAVTSSVVRLYKKAPLLDSFERDPAIARSFMLVLAREIVDLRTRLERRCIHSARERVRHYLESKAGPTGGMVVLPSTVKDLAAELGLSHEALYRTLADMSANGEIARVDGGIRLTSVATGGDHS